MLGISCGPQASCVPLCILGWGGEGEVVMCIDRAQRKNEDQARPGDAGLSFSMYKDEAGVFQVQGQPEPLNETLSQNKQTYELSRNARKRPGGTAPW